MMNQIIHRMLTVAITLSLLPCIATHAEEAGGLHIKDEAYVKGPKVYLSDLVEVKEPELQERLATIEVSGAAQPGGSKQLSASLIEARLQHAGVDLATLEGQQPSQVRTITMHIDVSPEMLAASLREHIELEMPWAADVTEIEIPVPRQALMAPEGEMSIAWRASPQYNYLGMANFRGEVSIDGELYRTVVLRASVETYEEILVAATDIPRGRPISGSQLTMQTVALSTAPNGAITDPSEVEGLVAKKTIFPGQPVTMRNIELRRLIKRNQMVSVEMETATIRIQHQARAMMDGREGDLIICANPITKEEFQGVVRSDGVVEIR